jgi:hypothetical protein
VASAAAASAAVRVLSGTWMTVAVDPHSRSAV